jgi:hypothetical protein
MRASRLLFVALAGLSLSSTVPTSAHEDDRAPAPRSIKTSHEAVPATRQTSYQALIDEYLEGDADKAVEHLLAWTDARVRDETAASGRVPVGGRFSAAAMAAVMLHTEALLRGGSLDGHLPLAGAIRPDQKAAFRARWRVAAASLSCTKGTSPGRGRGISTIRWCSLPRDPSRNAPRGTATGERASSVIPGTASAQTAKAHARRGRGLLGPLLHSGSRRTEDRQDQGQIEGLDEMIVLRMDRSRRGTGCPIHG